MDATKGNNRAYEEFDPSVEWSHDAKEARGGTVAEDPVVVLDRQPTKGSTRGR
jgi:hypothetical protein